MLIRPHREIGSLRCMHDVRRLSSRCLSLGSGRKHGSIHGRVHDLSLPVCSDNCSRRRPDPSLGIEQDMDSDPLAGNEASCYFLRAVHGLEKTPGHIATCLGGLAGDVTGNWAYFSHLFYHEFYCHVSFESLVYFALAVSFSSTEPIICRAVVHMRREHRYLLS